MDEKRNQDRKNIFWIVDQKLVPETLIENVDTTPIVSGLYDLTYACLLVPRVNNHYLAGDLSNSLEDWLQGICSAFGWQLAYIAMKPEYLQWVVRVQPNTSPGHMMRIVRQQTSEKIFSNFPRLKQENTTGDFWAPGYLVMGGNQPHPPQLVRDYIRQTSQQQIEARLAGDETTDAQPTKSKVRQENIELLSNVLEKNKLVSDKNIETLRNELNKTQQLLNDLLEERVLETRSEEIVRLNVEIARLHQQQEEIFSSLTLMLAGDPTVDAPLPDVKKKKRKS